MTHQDLRSLEEQLAERIRWVGAEVESAALGGIDLNDEAVLGAVVREVLRQMEWARREGMKETVKIVNGRAQAGDRIHVITDYGWPTLAPSDWKS